MKRLEKKVGRNNHMRRFDVMTGILFGILGYVYIRGYMLYLVGERRVCFGYALLCGSLILWILRRLAAGRYLRMKMKKVDKLSGRAFEEYLKVQFKNLGYRVVLTEFSHDYGADLILKKRGEKIVVQAKRYGKNVGIAAVQEVVGAIAYYNADRAMVVTNSGFTKSARNLAKQNDVELWGRYDIQKKFKIRE